MMSKLRLILVTGLIGLLAACHSGVKLDENANAKNGAVGTQPNPNAVQQVNVDPLNDPNSPLAKRSIYFDFDPGGRCALEDHDLLRLRQLLGQGRLPVAAATTRAIPEEPPATSRPDPGQHRRTRHERVQPGTWPEAC